MEPSSEAAAALRPTELSEAAEGDARKVERMCDRFRGGFTGSVEDGEKG